MIIPVTGGQTGATLTVASSGAGTITVSNTTLGKSYSKSVTTGGSVVFKGLKTGTWTIKLTDGSTTSTKTITITNDYSTNIAYFSATISITYPAKSTCVVKNSSGTTVASNTNTGSSAKTWTATVNATGTYTVTATATDGSGDTKSESVSITADGQSKSVELVYRTEGYLYNQGIFNDDYSHTETTDNGKITYNSTDFSVETITGGRSAYAFVVFENIEMDGQSEIAVNATPNSQNQSNSGIAIVLFAKGNSFNGASPSSNAAAYYHQNGGASGATNYSLDVSNVSAGIYNLAVGFTTAGGNWSDKRKYNINTINVT